ncbi:MAG: hypothetical protein IPG53_17885 [Ignavibacteriales bacterium]|nr:hypothetical protein [Ignavibacteriales bacterium]
MKRLLMLFIATMLLGSVAFSQNEKINQNADDALKELEEGELTLRFADALTGKPIKGGKVSIKSIGDFESDFEGRVFFATEEINKNFLSLFLTKTT